MRSEARSTGSPPASPGQRDDRRQRPQLYRPAGTDVGGRLKIGDARFTPAAIDATLTTGVLKAQVSNLGAYEGTATGDLTVDVSTANPTYTMRADLTGVRALPLLDGLADFDKIDGRIVPCLGSPAG